MFIYNYYFNPIKANAEAFEAAESFIFLLARFEHIYPNYILRWVRRNLVCTVVAVYSDSLKAGYFNHYLRSRLHELLGLLAEKPRLARESKASKPTPTIKQCSSLYLGATYLSENPVLKSGVDDAFIPLYALPMDPDFTEKLHFWGLNYRRYDGIQMACHDLEMPAYKQLATLTSQLTQDGRQMCQKIEKTLKKPVYYYLYRYWGFPDDEEKKRKCPSCNKAWRNPNWQHKGPGLTGYFFKCDRCRLISEPGSTDDNKRRAKIGTRL